jgi:7-cyano-7-deazaguanine synthase
LEHLAQIGGSSLTDRDLTVTPANLASDLIPTSYVPFRNAHFLSIATSWAEVIHADSIYIGAVAEDSSGYPDCRPEFYEAFQRAITLGTKPETKIEIKAPVIAMKKSQIVELGKKLNAPLELTWSCYKESDEACGDCDSCALRLRAFRDAGINDPIPYLLDSKRLAY